MRMAVLFSFLKESSEMKRTAIRYNRDGDGCMEENGRKILIAEDDADIVAVLRMYLENSGYSGREDDGRTGLHADAPGAGQSG